MNDEINPKDNLAEEWEMSLPEMPPGKNASPRSIGESSAKSGSTLQNQPEDWAMSPVDLSQPKEEITEDWGVTEPLKPPPTPPAQTGWKLPEPVFRSSEGCTPKLSFESTLPQIPAGTQAQTEQRVENFQIETPLENPANFPAAPLTKIPATPPIAAEIKKENSPPVAPPSAAKIEPQPDVIEDLIEAPPAAAPMPVAPPKSRARHAILIVAGLLAMLMFIVGFLILVYYFFLHKPPVE